MDNIEAVIFDLDGLMFDTENLYLKVARIWCKKNKIDIPNELLVKCIGRREDYSARILTNYFHGNFDAKKFRKDIIKLMEDDIKVNGLGVKKGLKELLIFLKMRKIKTAIASASDNDYVKKRLKEANISVKYFDSIIGGFNITCPKPDPEIYLKSMEVLNVKPDNTLIIEDSDYGVMSATSSGAKCIWVPDIKEVPYEAQKNVYRKCNSLLEVIDLFENN